MANAGRRFPLDTACRRACGQEGTCRSVHLPSAVLEMTDTACGSDGWWAPQRTSNPMPGITRGRRSIGFSRSHTAGEQASLISSSAHMGTMSSRLVWSHVLGIGSADSELSPTPVVRLRGDGCRGLLAAFSTTANVGIPCRANAATGAQEKKSICRVEGATWTLFLLGSAAPTSAIIGMRCRGATCGLRLAPVARSLSTDVVVLRSTACSAGASQVYRRVKRVK